MHAKYEVSISYCSYSDRMLKLTTDKQTARQTNKQTGQKQYALDHLIWGIKIIIDVHANNFN